MRRGIAALAGIVMLAAVQTLPARAEAIDPSTATCAELTKTFGDKPSNQAEKDKQSRLGVLLLWMAGFLAPEEQGSVVDFAQLHSDIEKITTACMQTPTLGLKTVAAKHWEQKQATTSNSVDISTLTCATLTSERSAAAMLWLIGNYASDEDTPMFDMDEIGATVGKIAAVCAKTPKLSITSAAEKVLE